jgi:hypothetical protein
MIDLTDGLLNAFLDGELDPETAEGVAAALQSNPGARLRVERMRRVSADLRAAFPETGEDVFDPLAERIMTAPAPFAPSRQVKDPRPLWSGLAALAAGAAGLMIGQFSAHGVSAPTAQSSIHLDAKVQAALNNIPSGVAHAQAQTTVSFTLKTKDGRYCRQFNSPQGEGLACLSEGEWILAAWDASGARTQGAYEMAGASSLIDEAADRLQSAPLDAAAEAAALNEGWR